MMRDKRKTVMISEIYRNEPLLTAFDASVLYTLPNHEDQKRREGNFEVVPTLTRHTTLNVGEISHVLSAAKPHGIFGIGVFRSLIERS
jgi:hypothetical protein